MNKFGIIESSEIDVIKSLSAKDNNPANMVEAGYVAKYTIYGQIELATQSNVESEAQIAGVVCGTSGQKNHTGLCQQSVVCNGVRVAVKYNGTTNLDVGTVMYLDVDGTVTKDAPATPIIVGIVSAHSLGNSGVAYIKLNNM